MKAIILLFSGILLGAVGGMSAMWWRGASPCEPHHEVRYHPENVPINESPETLLYPPGTTLEGIYPDEALRAAILSPESIRIHRRGGDERLKVEKWAFSGEGIEPDAATQERLLYALGSLSAYEPPGKACIFNPGVLVRLHKDGRDHDLLFCFECQEMRGAAPVYGVGGMSLQGARTYLKCFCDVFPRDEELRKERERVER